jgi:hypothetical protein
MTTYITTNGLAGVRLNATETVAQFALMQEVAAQDATTFIYVQANGAISIGDVVTIDTTGQATRATIATGMLGHRLGFSQVAFADDEYGWIPVKGNPLSVNVSATSTLNVALYIGTTSGHLSTTAGSATVAGVAYLTANASTAVAAFNAICSWPRLRLDGLS